MAKARGGRMLELIDYKRVKTPDDLSAALRMVEELFIKAQQEGKELELEVWTVFRPLPPPKFKGKTRSYYFGGDE